MKITMTPIKSSNIQAIGYDKKELQLLVEFKGGKTFGYKYVSQDELKLLLSADSVGKHFNQFIKSVKVAQEIVETKEPVLDELTALKAEYKELREYMLMIEKIAFVAPVNHEILAVAQKALSHSQGEDNV